MDLNPADWAAWAAVGIALLALIVSVYAALMARRSARAGAVVAMVEAEERHDRLDPGPTLDVSLVEREGGLFVQLKSLSRQYQVAVDLRIHGPVLHFPTLSKLVQHAADGDSLLPFAPPAGLRWSTRDRSKWVSALVEIHFWPGFGWSCKCGRRLEAKYKDARGHWTKTVQWTLPPTTKEVVPPPDNPWTILS